MQPDRLILRAAKTKTKRMREIPISPTLQKIFDRRRKGPDGNDLPDDAHVFGDETGKPVSRRLANRWWHTTLKTAKITDNATQVGVRGAFKKLEAKRRRARMKIASGQ